MKFVSCFRISNASSGKEIGEIVLCRVELPDEKLPSSADSLQGFVIRELVVSEGTEIHTRCNCLIDDLHIFADGGLQKYIWYEFIRHLSGHKYHLPTMEGQVKFTDWVCYAPESGKWSLVMEIESQSITRKVAQLDLDPVESGELNLFQMTNELFLNCCQCNDELSRLQEQKEKLQSRIKELQEERASLDKLLEQRDAKTRAIVAGLLNEKKKKISELQRQLGDQSTPDSEIINRYVSEPLSEHISPGKRHRNPKRPKREYKWQQPIKKEEVEGSLDDFDDFEFLGIQKESPMKQEELQSGLGSDTSSTEQSTEQETDVEQNE